MLKTPKYFQFLHQDQNLDYSSEKQSEMTYYPMKTFPFMISYYIRSVVTPKNDISKNVGKETEISLLTSELQHA